MQYAKNPNLLPESDTSGILLISCCHSFLNVVIWHSYTDEYQEFGSVYMLGLSLSLTLSCLSLIYQVL